MDKLILIDDDAILRKAIARSIDWAQFGIELCGTAKDSMEGLELIARFRPDVVVTDIRMPNIPGTELSRIIHCDYPDIRVILLTGYEEFEYARQAIENHVFAYMTKPVKNRDLVETVMRAATEKRQETAQRLLLDAGASVLCKELFHGAFQNEWSFDKINATLSVMGVEAWGSCLVAILEVNNEDQQESVQKRGKEVAVCIEEASRVVGYSKDVFLVELGHGRFAAVVFRRDTDLQALLSYGKDICQMLSQFFLQNGYVLRGVFGNPQEKSPLALRASYSDASRCVLWYQNEPFEGVKMACDYIRKVPLENQSAREMLHQAMNQLAAAVLDPDANWKNAFQYCIRLAQTEQIEAQVLQISTIRLLNRLYDQSFLEPDIHEKEQIQCDVLAMSQGRKILDFLEEFCAIFRSRIESAQRSRKCVLMDQTLRYLNEHYKDPDFSLSVLANHMDVSYNYMSELFSSEVGETFQH